MKNNMTRCATIVGMGLGLMMPINMALAGSEPADNALTAEWWQWALSIPTPENPLLDDNGDKCVVGQHGSAWFLAGHFNGSQVTRTCTVPTGSKIFFPVINSINFNTPNVCGQDGNAIPVRDLRSYSAGYINQVDKASISVTIDGTAISSTRLQSPVFEVALPENNVFDTPCKAAKLGNVPAGIYSPAVDDGYYVTVNSLEQGTHKLHFQVKDFTGATLQDITYKLNVVRVSGDR